VVVAYLLPPKLLTPASAGFVLGKAGGGGGGGYIAQAVHFDGVAGIVSTDVISVANPPKITTSAWLKSADFVTVANLFNTFDTDFRGLTFGWNFNTDLATVISNTPFFNGFSYSPLVIIQYHLVHGAMSFRLLILDIL